MLKVVRVAPTRLETLTEPIAINENHPPGMTRRDMLVVGAALASSAATMGAWPSLAHAGSPELTAGRRDIYSAALDALADFDPYVDASGRAQAVAAFASSYRSMPADEKAQIDALLDAFDGPVRASFAARGSGERVQFLRRAIRGFDGRPADGLRSAQVRSAVDLIGAEFRPSDLAPPSGSSGYFVGTT